MSKTDFVWRSYGHSKSMLLFMERCKATMQMAWCEGGFVLNGIQRSGHDTSISYHDLVKCTVLDTCWVGETHIKRMGHMANRRAVRHLSRQDSLLVTSILKIIGVYKQVCVVHLKSFGTEIRERTRERWFSGKWLVSRC